jgi:murein DD-endopeptidase MepM/ murein hydrolase activator NlpD
LTPVRKSVIESVPIQRGDTLDELLGSAGVAPADRVEMLSAVKNVFDVRKLRAGSQITLARSSRSGVPKSLEYIIDPDHRLQLSRSNGPFQASIVKIPSELHVQTVCGILEGSLFESIERTGKRPELALQLAEIFAWDLDFYTDPQPGDQFCFLVEEKRYNNGQPATYGRILGARYDNAGSVFEGYMVPDHAGKAHYYSADGRSLASAFLRSPLKFSARVSSRFSRRRFHPVLKTYRPHLGTDYAAPVGVPVQAVGAGTVTFSGRSGGAGNLIKISHPNGYESMYMHLSRRFVQRGQRVSQGQRIGAVGATGLATGPHLDFRLRRNGQYLNFERINPRHAGQLDPAQIALFTPLRDQLAAAAAVMESSPVTTTTANAVAAPEAGAGDGID